ncbi:MAG: LysR family transcriptional regulator [Leucobacter sp.]
MAQRFSVTLTQLSYFAECAKTLNMTLASQELHVAQSAVSTAISHLERALGASLFIRQRARGLILTPAGEQLLHDTHRVFGLLADSIDSIRADGDEVRGSITVACFKTLAPFLLPLLIARLHDRHPELSAEFVEGDNEETLAALRSGRAEIAVNYRFGDAEGISSEHAGDVRPHVVLPAGHPLAERQDIALAELAGEPLVLLDLPDSSGYFLDILRGAGVAPQVKHRTSSYETVRSMVAMGLGYSILNQRPRIPGTYTGDAVATVAIRDETPALEIVVSSLAQVHRSARARAVADLVREIIAEQQPAG